MTKPPKSEAPAATGAAQEANQRTDGRIVGESDVDRKRFATLSERFTVKGHELHRLVDGGFLATKWGMTRELRTLTDAEAFLHQIGGAA